jgi:hypothetical protein
LIIDAEESRMPPRVLVIERLLADSFECGDNFLLDSISMTLSLLLLFLIVRSGGDVAHSVVFMVERRCFERASMLIDRKSRITMQIIGRGCSARRYVFEYWSRGGIFLLKT